MYNADVKLFFFMEYFLLRKAYTAVKGAKGPFSNQRLRRAREQRGWSQKDVADKIDTDPKAVGRWERGIISPSPHYRQKLCALFGMSAGELGFLLEDINNNDGTTSARLQPNQQVTILPPPIWNISYRRNPFFTGREDILLRLHDAFTVDKTKTATFPQVLAISGLGGIGKTQTAIEYTYRYLDTYRFVLWARADTLETLISDYLSIAELLKLPEKDERNQNRVINALNRWLETHSDWLLILDNADDLAMTGDFIPRLGRGHVLLTTREQVIGSVAQHIEIEKMEPGEGVLFLLRRAKMIASDAPLDSASYAAWDNAKDIVQMMDGLPLALDQAGAYIEETSCGLSGYLQRYQTGQARLLHNRGTSAVGHPETVALTWYLSFEKVQKANPIAANLLQLCAFLHPDAIPEEIITEGIPELGPILQAVADDPIELDTAIRELRRFSLVKRDPEARLLVIHRLVQVALKDGMDEIVQRLWVERTVRAVNRAFPDGDQFVNWQRCQRYLPHAIVCATLIEQWAITFPEAIRLLNQAGNYLLEHAHYAPAESLFQQALKIGEQTLGPEHTTVTNILDKLAGLYHAQGKYTQAEPLYLRVLVVREQTLGSEHSSVAEILNNLALLYYDQGKYPQAEPLMQRALTIGELAWGQEHSSVAQLLSNLALLYYAQHNYVQAEPLYWRALHINEQSLGVVHPRVAINLNNLAMLYRGQCRYTEAEPLFQRALVIRKQILDPEHPDIATSLNNLAGLYRAQNRYTEAEPLFKQALTIREKMLGSEHPDVANSLYNLAVLYKMQGKYVEAESLLQRALTIREQVLGMEHPDVVVTLEDYTDLLRMMNKLHESG